MAAGLAKADVHLARARPLIVQLHDGKAWESYDLPDWKSFCEQHLGIGLKRWYQLKRADEIEQQLLAAEVYPVDNQAFSERHCRELAKIPDPSERAEVAAELYSAGTPKLSQVVEAVREKTAADKLKDMRQTEERLALEAKVDDARDAVVAEETCVELLGRCVRWYESIAATAKRARRHHGIATGTWRDSEMERLLDRAMHRANRRAEKLRAELAAMTD